MSNNYHPIRCALISTSNKIGLEALSECLVKYSVQIISTGGTADFLRHKGFPVTDISLYTGFDEILEGQVKTLHPLVFGGILGKQNNLSHQTKMKMHGISPIDMVVVNFYDFKKNSEGDYDSVMQHIDIGGPTMARAAAKNHENVTVVTTPEQYSSVINDLNTHQGATSLSLRQKLAFEAFMTTMNYDYVIQEWFHKRLFPDIFASHMAVIGEKISDLRYGENAHQKAALYSTTGSGIASAKQLHGKALSYTNISDADSAWCMACEFDEPVVIIVKHNNPCAAAVGLSGLNAWNRAIVCDSLSSFGGIVACNVPIDKEMAKALISIFIEIIIAPRFAPEALEILKEKKNLRLLIPQTVRENVQIRQVSGGFLAQTLDSPNLEKEQYVIPTKIHPDESMWRDLLFAEKLIRFVKSNAVILVRDGQLIGVGCGQTSRIDSVFMAIHKAERGLGSKGCVAVSDGFFPFTDGPQALIDAGITCIMHPGGSVRDNEIIELLDATRCIPMVITNRRHFLH